MLYNSSGLAYLIIANNSRGNHIYNYGLGLC